MPSNEEAPAQADVVVIGAGPAGLAVAAGLIGAGRHPEVLERASQLAASWRNHYDRLHLHTVKEQSALPGMPFAEHLPRYVPRQGMVDYLAAYAERHGIRPHVNVQVTAVVPRDGAWRVATAAGPAFAAPQVVVATGANALPRPAPMAGEDVFGGRVLHSRDYRNAAPFAGQRVLVVGMGNTGAEIALDLAVNGVHASISVRSPMNIVRRDIFGRPSQLTSIALSRLPARWGDAIASIARDLSVGDLSRHGIRTAGVSPLRQLREQGKTPTIDVGTVDAIKAGRIAVRPGVERLTPTGARFTDGSEGRFDSIVLATGYRAEVEALFPETPVPVDANGLPLEVAGRGALQGVFFVGFDLRQPGGLLRTIAAQAQAVATSLAARTTTTATATATATALVLALAGLAGMPRQALAADPPSVATPSAHARISFERVRFPGAGPRVGLVGTSYLVDLPEVRGLSIGPAVYGAVSGRHGGFFTLGGELAWRQRLIGPVGVEVGVFAGGGGGGGAPAGSGLMLRPHADLVWDLGPVALGASVSHVRYSGDRIDSTQFGLVLNANSDFRFVPAQRLGEPARAGGRAGLGFDRVQLVGGVYRTPRGKTLQNGEPLPRHIGTLGIRAEQSWGGNAFWGIEAARAGRDGIGGYAEYLGSIGVETEIVRDALTLGARVGAGMAGGGGVSTGGGLLVKTGIYGIARLGNDLGLAVEAGYARAPGGNFRAAQASVALLWALDGPASTGTAARPARTDFSAGAERFDAPRGGGDDPVTGVRLKIDRYLTSNLYVTGQALAAAGGNAGGYSAALVGVGWNQPLGSRLHVGAELLGGAGGGGGVDARGALLQPRAYAGVQLTPSLALRAGAGRVRSSGGRLSSNVFDLSLNVTYGVSSGI
ncbi:MAG TPA: NAD(P)/FAD-dependent oxidoreductase [Caldimonas sp.]|jgi:cation diffusion facilitator CzcD-associated flavoprotein CzcO|nr:NAD(P)/FAD-dependent oxidoreductase [Caldimonas sp.]HEX2541106.1 NAD(P)/FAD-dependent oxidoreductase [Caldimonas sp.]